MYVCDSLVFTIFSEAQSGESPVVPTGASRRLSRNGSKKFMNERSASTGFGWKENKPVVIRLLHLPFENSRGEIRLELCFDADAVALDGREGDAIVFVQLSRITADVFDG